MANKNFIEDMLTLGTGMLSNLSEARHEIKSQAKQRAGSVVRSLDLVSREEFDAAFAMIAKARDLQEDLVQRLTAIEGHLKLSRPKSVVKNKKTNLPSVKTKTKKRSSK